MEKCLWPLYLKAIYNNGSAMAASLSGSGPTWGNLELSENLFNVEKSGNFEETLDKNRVF